MFPTFNEVFGNEDDDDDFDREREVFIKFSTQYAPQLSITQDGIFINGSAVLNVMNPLNKDLTAAIIYCNFTSSLKAQMKDEGGLMVKGSLDDLTLTANYVKPLFRSSENVESIGAKMQAVKQMLFLGMNKLLQDGIHVPMPSFLQNDLTDSSLTQYNQYLLLEANTNVHEYLTKDTFLKMIS